MHRKSGYLLIALGLVIALTIPASAISLTEYTFPTSRSQEAYMNGTFSSDGSTSKNSQTGYNASGGASYNYYYLSLPFTTKLLSQGYYRVSRGDSISNPRNSSYDFTVAPSVSRYFRSEDKFFSFGSGQIEYLKTPNNDHAYKPYIQVTTGIGYGRTINATVLKQAVRMSEDFKRFQVTKGDIPDESLLKLAQIINNESEYRTKYGSEEYGKYWYNAMEEVLRETGMLNGDRLSAIGILRIQEVLKELTGQRFYGWEARIGFSKVVSDTFGKSYPATVQLSLDWSRPISMALQLNNNFYCNTNSDSIFNIGNRFQIYYEFSNRIHWNNYLDINAVLRTKSGHKHSHQSTVYSDFQFYIENQFWFNTTFRLDRSDNRIDKPLSTWSYTSGINYRLR